MPPNNPPSAIPNPQLEHPKSEPSLFFALPALLALGIVAALALFPDPQLLKPDQMAPEKHTLLFLLVAALIALWPSFSRRLLENRDAATWAFLVVGVILFHLADRAGPRAGEGFGLKWSLTPDDPIPISYATRAVLLGALLSIPAWIRGGAPERALIGGLLLLGVLGAASFWLLSRFYAVGVTEILDPTSLGTLITQVVAYACLAVCARAATLSISVRALVLRLLPIVLLIVWARHQFAPIAAPVEAE